MARSSRRRSAGSTVGDVAAEAGVSMMTVSRVINNAPNVRPATRDTVLAAIERLNYSPNRAARLLAAGDASQIGLLYDNPSAFYLSQFLIGALSATRRAGSHLVLEACEGEDEAEATRRFTETPVTGVILIPPFSEAPAVLEELEAIGIPVVTVAGSAEANVRIDDHAAAHEIGRHFLSLGHRRFGFVRGHPNQRASAERERGFRAALAEAGFGEDAIAAEQGYYTFRSGTDAAERLLDRAPDVTAIFASNDEMAVAAIGAAHRRGIAVPEALSVVGYDDTGLATTSWPELTTVRQPVTALAEAAVELLLDRTRRGADAEPAERVLDHEFVVRASTGPAPLG